jgi:hypothetical protein
MGQTHQQGAQTRKQGALIRKQRVRERRERARLKLLTDKHVEDVVVPRSSKIPGWVPLAGMIFNFTFGIIVSITAICIAVLSAE